MRRPYRRNIARVRRTRGCLTDCVAYFLNVHPEHVPFFVYPRAGWMMRLRRFFGRRGLTIQWVPCTRVPAQGIHIVCGNSLRWKTSSHVVVYRAVRLAYDPDFPSRWSDARMTHRLIVEGA